MCEDKRVADYFVTVGLNKPTKPETDYETLEPITDVAVIFKSAGETPPDGFECIEFTPGGLTADLNHGSIRTPSCYLCYRRGRDKPPLTDIGVLHEGRQKLMHGCDIVYKTPSKMVANVNNASNSRLFITYRRASPQFAHSSLAVIDICVILTNKGEKPPHAFCLINKNLNQGLVGSVVNICYRKSLARTNSLSYSAEIISKYPPVDYTDYPLPDSVQLFCLPLGAVIECWPDTAQPPLPIFSTFALTDATGEKIYGAGVTFFEEFPEEKYTEEVKELLIQQQENHKDEKLIAQTNKCICLLSRFPFFDAFRRFLMSLYRLSVSGEQHIPIERYISHFMHNVPFPTPKKPRVFVQMTHEGFEISEPSHGPLPVSGASYTALLRCLGPENTLTLLSCILTEQKILVHSLRPALLTSVCEALISLIFPFQWKCPYIPLCPLILADVISAPFPYIYGIDSRYFDQGCTLNDVTCVDLDNNVITQAVETKDFKQINWKFLPKKPGKILKDKLDHVFLQLYLVANEDSNSAVEMAPLNVDAGLANKKEIVEGDIQEAFLRFHAQILEGYKQFLLPITSRPDIGSRDLTTLFDLSGFVKSRPRGMEKFFQLLTKTQLFSHFVESRSLSSSNDAVLMFFDECIEKCETPAPLLHSNKFPNSSTTVVVTPPDMNGLPTDTKYIYNRFPFLRAELFNAISPTITNLKLGGFNTPPRSPIVGRTKLERQLGTISARKQANSPRLWASCLLGHCYTIWFIHLPAFVKFSLDKEGMLKKAFEVLQRISDSKAKLPDEVCYRVLMQLSGQYNHPALAVKVLSEMKRNQLQPNAVTWGYYHKAVLEGKWSTPEAKRSPNKMWRKLRIVFMVVHALKGRQGELQRESNLINLSTSDEGRPLETSSMGAASDAGYSSSLLSTEDLTHQQPVAECLIQLDDFANDQDLKKHCRNVSMSSQESDFNEKSRRRMSETSITSNLSNNPTNHIVVCHEPSQNFCAPPSKQSSIALEALMCSCEVCETCDKVIYDEEIMGSWSANDSNLNISCPFCQGKRVPNLQIKVKDYRGLQSKVCSSNGLASSTPRTDQVDACDAIKSQSSPLLLTEQTHDVVSSESDAQKLELFFSAPILTSPPSSLPSSLIFCSSANASSSAPTSSSSSPNLTGMFYKHRKTSSTCSFNMFLGSPSETIINSVPYLSPLVLRKELENLLENHGENMLLTKSIVSEKPILYWNMVWYFRRLTLPSHLPSLLLISNESQPATGEVVISTSWDLNRQTEDNVPVYMLWNLPSHKHHLLGQKELTPYSILTTVNAHVMRNDLMQPMKILLEERTKQQRTNSNVHWSLYRELLFLSLISCGDENIDIDVFDREYGIAYKEILREFSDRLFPDDKSPSAKAVFCRQAFLPPTLQPRKAKIDSANE